VNSFSASQNRKCLREPNKRNFFRSSLSLGPFKFPILIHYALNTFIIRSFISTSFGEWLRKAALLPYAKCLICVKIRDLFNRFEQIASNIILWLSKSDFLCSRVSCWTRLKVAIQTERSACWLLRFHNKQVAALSSREQNVRLKMQRSFYSFIITVELIIESCEHVNECKWKFSRMLKAHSLIMRGIPFDASFSHREERQQKHN
jgi:hypothetical protein